MLRMHSALALLLSVLFTSAVFGSPLPGSQSPAKHEPLTVGLRKHVFLPDIYFDATIESPPDAYWTLPMRIGAQELELAPDTSLSSTVLFNGDLGYCYWCTFGNDGVSYYDPKQSPAHREVDRSTSGWRLPSFPYVGSSYTIQPTGNATADIKGTWMTDRLRVGSLTETFFVTPLILARLEKVSSRFMAGGALGLAPGIDFHKSAIQRILTGFEKKEVTLWFQNGTVSSDDTSGTITFGDRDMAPNCDTHWVETIGDWMFELTDVNVGPTPLLSSRLQKVGVGATISITTPFLELPLDKVEELRGTLRYFANITDLATGSYEILLAKCADVTSLPPITIQTGDISTTVIAQEYTLRSKKDPNTCVILIKPTARPTWTLGLPFLPKGCISYDYENSVLGFAKPATP